VIARYTRPELGALWTEEAKLEAWRLVEVAACEEMEGPAPEDLEAIRAARAGVQEVQEREAVTDHDVAAFVDVLSAAAGPAGRWIHFGLTSSDVLDTALALQLRRVGAVLVPQARELAGALAERAREHVDTLCVGRTHGVHAEPTTFGIKLAGFAMEAHRNAARLERAFAQAATGAISGAVGTYSATSPAFETRVLARLGLDAEPVSTQVVPATATPSCSGPSRSRAPGSSGWPRRCAICSARRCSRPPSPSGPGSRRAPARCRTSATRSTRSG
jgi:adenylosuccinate lyase